MIRKLVCRSVNANIYRTTKNQCSLAYIHKNLLILWKLELREKEQKRERERTIKEGNENYKKKIKLISFRLYIHIYELMHHLERTDINRYIRKYKNKNA